MRQDAGAVTFARMRAPYERRRSLDDCRFAFVSSGIDIYRVDTGLVNAVAIAPAPGAQDLASRLRLERNARASAAARADRLPAGPVRPRPARRSARAPGRVPRGRCPRRAALAHGTAVLAALGRDQPLRGKKRALRIGENEHPSAVAARDRLACHRDGHCHCHSTVPWHARWRLFFMTRRPRLTRWERSRKRVGWGVRRVRRAAARDPRRP